MVLYRPWIHYKHYQPSKFLYFYLIFNFSSHNILRDRTRGFEPQNNVD